MGEWLPILRDLGVSTDDARAIAGRAATTGTTFLAELRASGVVGEERLYRALAAELGVDFETVVDASRIVIREAEAANILSHAGGIGVALSVRDGGTTRLLFAPERLNIPAMRALLRRQPDFAVRLCMATPTALRQAVIDRAGPALQRMANENLFAQIPDCSARQVISTWQAATLGALAVAVPVMALTMPFAAGLAFHAVVSCFFLACVLLRLVVSWTAAPPGKADLRAFQPREMPTYTVLVALYKEAAIVPDLLVALGQIVWPRSKLEIKLVCEEDDRATIAAIEAQTLKPWIEVIKVPKGGPRTKPKALCYALPMSRGEFVVLYDAEDKPHPMQLVEAWQRFRDDGVRLACLQAPLAIANRAATPLTALFALEYSALFRGILPWLAGRNLLLPLGGTSNHFRRDVLEKVGAWDPYNVTEDADLGMRLVRFGYRTGTIRSPTYEDAPEDLRTWLPQRTRWFKGWAQTWFVHMRQPFVTMREVGFGSFVMAQILFAGLVLSALAHPFMLAFGLMGAARLTLGEVTTPAHPVLYVFDIANVLLGYTTFLTLGWLTMKANERKGFWKLALLTPVYWAMMSLAAFRSFWQLYRRPHHWEKTPHRPHGLAAMMREKAGGPEPASAGPRTGCRDRSR